jgi:hypothetical protein
VGRKVPLSFGAQRLLQADLTGQAYVRLLVAKGLYGDAVQFVAHALPNREAVWWACLCTRYVVGPRPPDPERAALYAAVQWVLKPAGPQGQAARRAGDAAGRDSLAGRVARAIAVCDKANPERAARLVGAAVLHAAQRGPAAERTWCYRQFLSVALEVHRGPARWAPRRGSRERTSPPRGE